LNDNIRIRPYREGDEEEIVELLELAFDGWPNFDLPCTPLEHWQWKYRDNPENKCIIVVAEKDDEIVGCMHTLFMYVKFRERYRLFVQFSDAVVNPIYRKHHVWTTMGEFCRDLIEREGETLIIAFMGNPIVMRKAKEARNRKRFPHILTTLIKIKDIDYYFENRKTNQRIIDKAGLHLLTFYNRLRNSLVKSNFEISRDVNIMKIDRFRKDINVFWRRIADQYDFIVKRNQDYLNWRYCDPRGGKYQIKIAKKKDEVLGYVVFRERLKANKTENKTIVGYIIDLVSLPKHLNISYGLLELTVQYFEEKSINLIQSWIVKNHSYEDIFRRQGFIDSKIRPEVSYGSWNSNVKVDEMSSQPSRIHIQYGDTDWI
jgi:hypothetical protein